jgi:hypothetical protein
MATKLVHQIPVRRMNFHNLKTCFNALLVADLKSVITFECQFYLMQEVFFVFVIIALATVFQPPCSMATFCLRSMVMLRLLCDVTEYLNNFD